MNADLDDFFAKKDKNRKKKIKGISNEDFVQKYETKCKDNSNKEKKTAEVFNNLEGFIQDDGEWKDFEDENKDYSGLKIQNLVMSDEEQREKEEEDVKKEVTEIPWGKKEDNEDNTTDDKSEPEEQSTEEPTTKEEEPKSQLNIIKELLMNSRKNKSQGPRIQIDDSNEFPDLGVTPEEIENGKSFQLVRNKAPQSLNQHRQHQESIITDNKYNALRNHY